MRLAIIDLGTNSVRFDVHEVGADREVYTLHREKLMIRLGDGVFQKGKLNPRSIKICVEAFESFARTLNDFKVNRVVAFGTSALREAKDSSRLINAIHRKTGIRVRMISGEEEARLIARGVLANESQVRSRFVLIDIGGGSTEVIVCSGRRSSQKASFELGTARLQQVFLKTIPPAKKAGRPHPIDALRRHIRGTLLYRIVSEQWPKRRVIVGSSGTIKALIKMGKQRTGEAHLNKKTLGELISEMASMSRNELLKIPGMESRRVDMILAGAILLEECMIAFGAESVESTDYSLRDGMLNEQIEFLRLRKVQLLHDPIDDLWETAKDLGVPEAELKSAFELARLIFSKLKPLHRLEPRWLIYLVAGSLLYRSGRSISAVNAEAHSAYVARHADIPQLEDWESELVAELCRHAKNGKLIKKSLPFSEQPTMQRRFLRLLSLLRIVVALSYQRDRPVPLVRVKIEKKRVNLYFSRRSNAALALLRADQRKSLFEETFKRALILDYDQ
jgi:exopolyphosphatase/guanosine-5'-triphosphate,3'-diphosphate pyrophosphatase